DIARWRGRTVPHPHLPGLWVVPGLQPSKLMSRHGGDDDADNLLMRHPPRFHGVWIHDIHQALAVARDGFVRRPVSYALDPSADAFGQFADAYMRRLASGEECFLSFDVETAYSFKKSDESDFESDEVLEDWQIVRVSFSHEPFTGVSVPWGPSYLPTIKALLASQGPKVGWNCRTFDVPLLEQRHSVPVLGEVYDAQDAYHLLQSDLPKGL